MTRKRVLTNGLALLLSVILVGCQDGYDLLNEAPRQATYPVFYHLNLMGEGHLLREPYQMMFIKKGLVESDHVGAMGILVTHTQSSIEEETNYFAYDLACPYDWPSLVAIEKGNDAFMQVQCPKCGTVYDLSMGAGIPISGPGHYPLMSYDTRLIGWSLEITNR